MLLLSNCQQSLQAIQQAHEELEKFTHYINQNPHHTMQALPSMAKLAETLQAEEANLLSYFNDLRSFYQITVRNVSAPVVAPVVAPAVVTSAVAPVVAPVVALDITPNPMRVISQVATPMQTLPKKPLVHRDYESIMFDYLDLRGVQIERYPEEPEEGTDEARFEEHKNRVALWMGENYPYIQDLYRLLKYHMQKGRGASFEEHMRGNSQKVALCKGWLEELKALGMVLSYQYHPAPYDSFAVHVSQNAATQIFLGGQWFERCALGVIRSVVEEIEQTYPDLAPLSCYSILNPQIKLPNQQAFELDLLYEINQKVYWIEAKAGEPYSHISKYSQAADQMKFPTSHAFLVFTETMAEETMPYRYPMQICNIARLRSLLLAQMKKDLGVG